VILKVETLQNGLDNKIYMAEHASKAKTQDAGRYRWYVKRPKAAQRVYFGRTNGAE